MCCFASFVIWIFIVTSSIFCYVIVSCNVESIKLVLVQGCASPDAVLRRWLEATSTYIISKKSKLTCLWLHKEKEKLKMKIVRFKLNGKNCIFLLR